MKGNMLRALFIISAYLYSAQGREASLAESSPEDATFVPGTLPLDADGNPVHAHGGGIFQQNGTFFWYGTTQKYPPAWISRGINLYSSVDLQTWKFEGQIFADEQIKGQAWPHPFRIERPKILFSLHRQEFTMLFHLDTPSFALTSVGVAKASDIRGPWQWIRSFKPDGLDSYDMTAWQDEDGAAYLARSVENRFLGVSRLRDDFADTDGSGVCAQSSQAEAPSIFKRVGGRYFIIASHLTGWSANAAIMFTSEGKTLCDGELKVDVPPTSGPGAETTFDSQPAFVFPLTNSKGDELFIYVGDRWNFYGPGCVGAASYVWLPLLPRKTGGGYKLVYLSKWSPKEVRDIIVPDEGVWQWLSDWVGLWLSRASQWRRSYAVHRDLDLRDCTIQRSPFKPEVER